MRVADSKNKHVKRISRISFKGLVSAVALLIFLMVIQVIVFLNKLLPVMKTDLSPVVDSSVVNYVESLMYKMFWGVGFWGLCFIVASFSLIYVLFNIKQYFKKDGNE